MNGAMLRCKQGFLRNLGTGVRLGRRFQSHTLSHLGDSSYVGINIARSNFSSASQPQSPHAKFEELFTIKEDDAPWPATTGRRVPVSQRRVGYNEEGHSQRNAQLAKTYNYNRYLTRDRKREIQGTRNEVDKLMEIAKGSGLPAGVNSSVVARELDWLKDPAQLRGRTSAILRYNIPLAVAILRRAESAKMETSASWNTLLSFCFRQGAPLAAFRFYNDMKKRGRAPTEHTYSIMLRGLCRESLQPSVKPVDLAYKIFRQLLDDDDVVPNHYHYHAMLEVCGTYTDMNMLWTVVGDLPEVGPYKPTAQTYSIILQAILNALDNDLKIIPEDQMGLRKEKRDALILDAKRIWADVINQWRKGELEIDGDLVARMAWVLVDPMDEGTSYNALALFNQTMGVPILVPQPKTDLLQTSTSEQGEWEANVRLSKKLEGKYRKFNYTSWKPHDSELESEDMEKPEDDFAGGEGQNTEALVEDLGDVFDPVEEVNSEGGPSLVKPENKHLHIILTVCRILSKGTAPGRGYWNLFTLDHNGYHVEPDPGNFYAYLRLLRISRSSQTALDVVRKQLVPTGNLDGKALHIAMSCCLRDRTNPNVLVIAQSFLSLMQEHLPLPDPKSLISFIELANVLTDNPQWLLVIRGLEDFDPSETNLSLIARNLRWALRKTVIASLEPHANRLYESMERVLNSSKPYMVGPSLSQDTVRSYLALQFMIKFRELLDKALGSQHEGVMTKADIARIQPLAIKLRKFSNPEIADQIEKAETLRPLTHHYSLR